MIKRGGGGRALAVLGVIGMLLVGCGGDDPASDPGGPGPDGSDPGGMTATGFATRLATLPAAVAGDSDQIIQIAVADLDRAAELAGLTRPVGSTDPDELREYVNALSGRFTEGPPVAALFPEAANIARIDQVDEFAAELGWSVSDVSWFAEYQMPPNAFTVIGGDLAESRLTDALGERPDDGIWRLGGEDHEVNLEEVSAARPLGEALRLALVDDHLVMSRTTPPVAAALTGGASLAEDPRLSALAAAMDAESAYSALFLTGQPSSFQAQALPPQVQDQAEARGAAALPQPFTGLAVGSTQIDGTPYAVFAYVHDDEAAATANADALRTLLEEGVSLNTGEPWSEQFGVADIRVDGATVVARLTLNGNPPILPYNVLMQRDNIASHASF
jgi:hypothetical protein